MKTLTSMKVALTGILLFCGIASHAASTTFTGASNQDWGNAANWSSGVPNTGDDVVINAGQTVNVLASTVSIATLTMNSGSVLNLGSADFTVSGTSSLQGTIGDNTAGGVNTFIGAGTVTGNLTFAGNLPIIFNTVLTINSGAVVTNNNTQVMPVQAIGSPTNGITVPTSGGVPEPYKNDGGIVLLTGMAGSGSWTQGTNASLSYNTRNASGAITIPATITFSSTATGNTVRYFLTTGGGITVPDFDYFNLQTCGSNNSCDYTVSVNRSITGTWTHDGGRMDVRTLATSLSDRVVSINNLTVRALNNAQRLFRVVTNTRNCTVNISGVLTRAATTSTNTGQAIDGGNASNRLVMLSGSTFRVEGNGGVISSSNITWSAGSTVEYTGGTTSLPANLNQTFSNFIWNCPNQTASLSLANVTAINRALRIYRTGSGSVTITNGSGKSLALTTLELRSGNLTLSNTGAADVTLADSLKALGGSLNNGVTNSTIVFNGSAGNQVLVGGSSLSGNLGFVINKSSGSPTTVTAGSNFTFPFNLTLTSGSLTADATARTLTITGDVAGAGGIDLASGSHTLAVLAGTSSWSGAFTAGTSSTVSYNSASGGQGIKIANYANLSFNDQFKNIDGGTIGVSGTFTPGTEAPSVDGASIFHFNGSGAQAIPSFGSSAPYRGLTVSGGNKTLASNLSVFTNLTSNSTITLGSSNLSLSNTATISGSSYVITNGSGQLIKNGTLASQFNRTYLVGTSSGPTPVTISNFAGTIGSGTLSIRSIASKQANAGAAAANRYWVLNTTGITSPTADIAFTYLNPTDVSGGSQSNYALRYWDGSAWQTPNSPSAAGANPATTTGSTNINGDWTVGETSAFSSITSYTSTGSGNWFSTSTWSPSGVPAAADNVIIGAGHTVTLGSNNAVAKNVTLTGTLEVSSTTGHSFDALAGNGSLRTGTTNIPTVSDKSAFVSSLGGTLVLLSGSTYPAGWFDVNNLTIGDGTPVSISAGGTPLNVAGTLLVQDGSFTATTINLDGTLTNAGTLVNTNLNLTGNGIINGLSATSLTNLTNNGSYSLGASSITISGTLSGSGSFGVQSGTPVTISGTVVDGLTMSSGGFGSSVSYTGSAGQLVIPGSYFGLTINNQNKSFKSGATYTVGGVFSPGTATGHTVANTTFSFTGANNQAIPAFQYHNLSATGANRVLDNAGSIKISGNFTTTGISFTSTGSTVEYNGSTAQTIGDLAYNNLVLSTSGSTSSWALTANRTMTGSLTISGGTNLQVSGAFTLTSAGTSEAITVSAGTMTVSSGTTVTVLCPLTVSGTGAVANNGSLNFSIGSSYVHNRNGGAIPSANWNASSTIELSGVTSTAPSNMNQNYGLFLVNNAGQTIDFGFGSGTPTMAGLTINNTNGMLFTMSAGGTSTAVINGNITVGPNGRYSSFNLVTGNTSDITVNGNFIINGLVDLSARSGGNTINFFVSGNLTVGATGTLQNTIGGASKIVLNGTSNATLTISGTHTNSVIEFAKTAPATVNITSNLTLQNLRFVSGSYTLANSPVIDIKRNITVLGDVSSSGLGTLNLNGTATQSVSGAFTVQVPNLTINNSAGVTITGTILSVGGNFTHNQGLTFTSGQLLMKGSSAQTISSPSAPLSLASLKIDGVGGMVTLNTGITLTGNFEPSNRFVHNDRLISLAGTTAQTISGSGIVYSLTNSNSSAAVTFAPSSNISIVNTLTLGANSNTTNNGSVILVSTTNSTARLNAVGSNATWTGNMTIERKVPSTYGWYFLSNPTRNSLLSSWDNDIYFGFTGAGRTGNPNAYFHNESVLANNGWSAATNVTNSVAGKGVRVFLGVTFSGTRTLTTTGAPIIGNGADGTNTGGSEAYDYSPTFSPSGFDGGGWNLVGNPYPSAINWDALVGWNDRSTSNIDATVYVWNAASNSYMTYNYNTNIGSPNTFTGVIPMGQAFFVKANAGSPSLTSAENVKVSGTANLFREAATIQPVRLTLSNNGQQADEAIIGFDPNTTAGFDPMYDARKLQGSLNSIAVKLHGGSLLSTSIQPLLASDTLDLRIYVVGAGTYQIAVDGLVSQPHSFNLYLLNRNTGQLSQLVDGQSVSITSTAAGVLNNYAIVVSSGQVTALAGNLATKVGLNAYPNPTGVGQAAMLYFSNTTAGLPVAVTILDAAGKVVSTTVSPATGAEYQQSMPTGLSAGVYTVRYTHAGHVGSAKIVVL